MPAIKHGEDVIDAAKAYDKYVIENKLEHTINFKDKQNVTD